MLLIKNLIDLRKKLNRKDGVFEFPLTSWSEFNDVVNKLNTQQLIWRGQRENWSLKSSFDRNPESSRFDRQKKLNSLLKKFKKNINGLPKKPSGDISNDEMWAIGQHYGLPTPLLDWTRDPFKAAYFAFFEATSSCQTKNRVIFALDIKNLHRLKAKYKKSEPNELFVTKPFVEFIDISSPDKYQNKRLKAQEGTFTKALNGDDIETNILKFVGKKPEYILLVKIIIPDTERDACLKDLCNTKKITHIELFPDHAGAAESSKIDLGFSD